MEISFFFPTTQILREINFGDSRGAKSAIFTHLEALNLAFHEFLHFLKGKIDQLNKNQKPKKSQKRQLCTSRILKIDFT